MFKDYDTDTLKLLQVFSATVTENEENKHIHSFGETEFYQLGIKLRGETRISYNRKTFCYHENSVLFLPRETSDCVPYNKVYKKAGVGICIFFTSQTPLMTEAGLYEFSDFSVADAFRELLSAYQKNDKLKSLSLFYKILGLLDESEKAKQNRPFNAALDYLRESAEKPYVDLKELAQRFDCSPDVFRHKFRREFGTSPKKFLSSVKINRAKELLLNSDNSINQIAAKLGFDDSNYFIRFFKKETEDTPAQFRKKFKDRF